MKDLIERMDTRDIRELIDYAEQLGDISRDIEKMLSRPNAGRVLGDELRTIRKAVDMIDSAWSEVGERISRTEKSS